MSRAVAKTLLPAARPASTIARPRPRELPVTNHTCAIHLLYPTEKELISAKNFKILMRRKQRSLGLCRDKAEARRRNRLSYTMIPPATGCSPPCYFEAPKRIGLTMVSILAAISSAGMRLGVCNQRRAAPKTAQAAVVAGSDESASAAIP